jgi:hypothetical protein
MSALWAHSDQVASRAEDGLVGRGFLLITGLTGGGYIAFDLSGTQTGPQSIGVRSGIGGPAPANIGMAIVRIQ